MADLLQRILGRTLTDVSASVYLLEGQINLVHPSHLMLLFDATERITFSCGKDGETMVSSMQMPSPIDMQEWGEFVIADFSSREPWASAVSHPLTSLYALVSGQTTIGFELGFARTTTVFICNLGDEIFVFDSWPKAIAEEEGLERLEIF